MCKQTCHLFVCDQSMFAALCRASTMHLRFSPPPSPLTTPPPDRAEKYDVDGDGYLVCSALPCLDALPMLHVQCKVGTCACAIRTSLPHALPVFLDDNVRLVIQMLYCVGRCTSYAKRSSASSARMFGMSFHAERRNLCTTLCSHAVLHMWRECCNAENTVCKALPFWGIL